jgi:peptidoglycan hydrolase CwlO-like protein
MDEKLSKLKKDNDRLETELTTYKQKYEETKNEINNNAEE